MFSKELTQMASVDTGVAHCGRDATGGDGSAVVSSSSVLSATATLLVALGVAGAATIVVRGWWSWTKAWASGTDIAVVDDDDDADETVRRCPLPPGSLGLPIVGEMIRFVFEAPSGEFFDARERRHGPIFTTHILGRPTIYVAGQSAVHRLLKGEHSLVETAWPAPMRRLLGSGALSTSVGDLHRRRRRLVIACLGRDRIRRYAAPMRAVIKDELGRWVSDGQQIDVYSSAKRMTIKAAARILLGVDVPESAAAATAPAAAAAAAGGGDKTIFHSIESDLSDYADGFFALPIPIPGTAFYKALRAKKRLHETLTTMLHEKKSGPGGLSPDDSYCSDVITDIFANIDRSTDRQETENSTSGTAAVDAALELLFGGQETLSGLVTCIVMLLADDGQSQQATTDCGPTQRRRQQTFEKMAAEVRHWRQRLVTSSDADVNDVTPELDNPEMLECVDAVVKETLRLYPPIGGGYRRALRTFDIAGFRVPRGWSVTYSIRATHDRCPLFADRTDSFVPERWFSLPPSRNFRFGYLPFGAGARSCVGREYAMLFARIFCVELAMACDGWRLTSSRPTAMLRVPVVRPREPLYAVFERRRAESGRVTDWTE